MKNTKPQSSIFSQALSEAVKDFAEEMGQKPAEKNEAMIKNIFGKSAESAIILSISKQDQIKSMV
jgi:hypothetical protein